MSDFAIQVEGLGKQYRIGNHAPYARFTELILGAAKAPFRLASRKQTADADRPSTFWALQDVNFTIQPGEIVGVIGRNGAGKSTLLKLLSRITEPTTGRIRYKGRVGSLLEVGTGFHPELTGRDNIYLNGAILGMTRAEVRRKFDEIVAFSEVEKFLDTAVKHYSSGMYMRLAFAVAAHLEPEILLVDEVLAVGDAEFQKKCLGKMGEVSKSGRTILFVSHNMAAIRTLCSRVALMSSGRLLSFGDTEDALTQYLSQEMHEELSYPVRLDPQITIHRFMILQKDQPTHDVDASLPLDVVIEYELFERLKGFRIGVFVNNTHGTVTRTLHADWDPARENASPGRYQAVLRIPGNLLRPGIYAFTLHASCFGLIDYSHTHELSKSIVIHPAGGFNSHHPEEKFDAMIQLDARWDVSILQ